MNWGSLWLDRVEASGVFSAHAIGRGADYARYDWQLEVDIVEGEASVRARSGRRMVYVATATVSVLGPNTFDSIVDEIAASTNATAALLDGELPDHLGDLLTPEPGEIELSCTCQTNDRPCKHAAAVLVLMAEAFDEDRFDLLHLRGLSRAELVRRVNAVRRGDDASGQPAPGEPPHEEPGPRDAASRDAPAQTADGPGGERLVWSEAQRSLPPAAPLPDEPGVLAPFASDPPANAGFTAAGLRTLANDAATRALALLRDGEGIGHHDLSPTADLARRASVATDKQVLDHLVAQSGLSTQEFKARARAWAAAGADGVEAHVAPVEIRRYHDLERDVIVQRRRTGNDTWVAFEKRSNRWSAVAVVDSSPDPSRYRLIDTD